MTLFYLMVGHALCDFTFQTQPMADGKNRHKIPTNIPPGAIPQTVWPYWLSAHALIHGGMVAWVTGNLYLGLAETVLHWMIDFAKCENWTGIHTDQSLHVGCKLLWWWL